MSRAGAWGLGLVAAALAVGGVVRQRVAINRMYDAQRRVLDVAEVPLPNVARAVSLGHTEWMTDMLYVNGSLYYGETVFAQIPSRYIQQYVATMEALDPNFRRLYDWGATTLVVQVGAIREENVRLAIRLLEQGLRRFPDDPVLNMRLGDLLSDNMARFARERHDAAGAAEYRLRGARSYRRAVQMGGLAHNPWIAGAAARYLEEHGRYAEAIAALREALVQVEEDHVRRQYVSHLAQLLANHAPHDPLREEFARLERARRREYPYVESPSLYLFVSPRLDGLAGPPVSLDDEPPPSAPPTPSSPLR